MGFTTRRSHAALASTLLAFILSASFADAADLKAMTYKGCYSSSKPLEDQGSYQYQTNGYCQPICVGKNQAVLGLSMGSDCWCGGQLPAKSSKVDDSKCDTPCNGFGDQMCGGNGFFSVYLTGTSNDVTDFQGAATSNTDQDQDPTTTSATATVITSISPGNTIVITQTATASSSPTNTSSSGTSTAGVAAGVVVGIVGAAAIAGGIFFLIRRRRRQRAEEDYKRSAQVSEFMSHSNDRRPPQTAYSQMSDSRLDPEHGRRNSVGSIQDEHDFSRRILRVANPDSH